MGSTSVNQLDLKEGEIRGRGRRVGLSRNIFKGGSLHQNIKGRTTQSNESTMPPKAALVEGQVPRKTADLDSEIVRSPDSSEDESDTANIQPSQFTQGPENKENALRKPKPPPARRTIPKPSPIRVPKRSKTTATPQSSQESSNSRGTPKRKNEEDHSLGASMSGFDGTMSQNFKKPKKVFGRSSSQSNAGAYGKSGSSAAAKNSKDVKTISESDSDVELETSHEPLTSMKKLPKENVSCTGVLPAIVPTFRNIGFSDPSDDEGEDAVPQSSTGSSRNYQAHSPVKDSPDKKPLRRSTNFIEPNALPSTPPKGDQFSTSFVTHSLEEDIFGSPVRNKNLTTLKAKSLVEELSLDDAVLDILGPEKVVHDKEAPTIDDDLPTMTQLARCPMCNAPVNPEELRAVESMNIRKQEKFCQSHQKKSAEDDWELQNYPVINWDKLDSRIRKHHTFIEDLVRGRKSHYRTILEELVKAGKDRTLLKSTTSITPGYYGPRGLHAISESILKRFTPLLKQMAVNDSLIAVRGVTVFVQSVIVPEVTVLLIKEDMSVHTDEARKILKESINSGEQLHKEIQDVVKFKKFELVDDSFDEDSD